MIQFFPFLNWNLVHICEGWKLTHCKFTTWLYVTSVQKCVVLCMLSSYSILQHAFDSEVLCWPKYIRAVPSASQPAGLQKMGQWGKILIRILDGLVISWNPAFHSMGRQMFMGGLIPCCVHSMLVILVGCEIKGRGKRI